MLTLSDTNVDGDSVVHCVRWACVSDNETEFGKRVETVADRAEDARRELEPAYIVARRPRHSA